MIDANASTDMVVARDISALACLKEDWDRLAPPDQSEPWQTYRWVDACANSFGKDHQLHVVALLRQSRLVAIAPLILAESHQPLHPIRYEFLGGIELKEPNRLSAIDGAALDLLADQLAREPLYPVRLSRIPNERLAVEQLRAAFRRRGWLTKTVSMPYPYLSLAPRDSPIKKSLVEDLKRGRRKAERRGPIQLEVSSLHPGVDLRNRLDDAFLIEASGWKGANQTAVLSHAARRAFFVRLADAAARDGTLRLAFLRVGGVDVASQYALESANAYWLLNIGYREEFRECSPGNLLLEATIREAAQRGLTRYNFLGKEEPWTRRWTSDVQDCVVFGAYRLNAFGARAILSDALYLLQKRRQDRAAQALRRRARQQ
jgi:CelD/BcsL family acetyltransferase involved in cellulose biosynthesis